MEKQQNQGGNPTVPSSRLVFFGSLFLSRLKVEPNTDQTIPNSGRTAGVFASDVIPVYSFSTCCVFYVVLLLLVDLTWFLPVFFSVVFTPLHVVFILFAAFPCCLFRLLVSFTLVHFFVCCFHLSASSYVIVFFTYNLKPQKTFYNFLRFALRPNPHLQI